MNERMREKQKRGSDAYPVVLYHLPNEQFPLYAPFHWQDDVEILHITGGRVELTLDRSSHLLHEGDVVCIMPGQLHSFRGDGEAAGCDIFIFPLEHLLFSREDHDQQLLLRPLIDGRYALPLRLEGEACHYALEAIRLQKHRPAAYEMQTKALLLLMIAHLQRQERLIVWDTPRQSDVCKAIVQYVHDHYAEPLTVPQIAAAVGISPTYFSVFFADHFAQPFSAYLRSCRISEGCRLLRSTTLSVAEIALAVGFGSSSHFIRSFRTEMGLTPRVYRKMWA